MVVLAPRAQRALVFPVVCSYADHGTEHTRPNLAIVIAPNILQPKESSLLYFWSKHGAVAADGKGARGREGVREIGGEGGQPISWINLFGTKDADTSSATPTARESYTLRRLSPPLEHVPHVVRKYI